MLTHATPEDGDIVIRQDKREGQVIYVLLTTPGADQYLLRTREEAVAQAERFARRQGVRAWFRDERAACVLLNDFRIVRSV
ncbi:MAG: hypothetical protein EHM55_18545 [Acidobacteria bacterium]|nr:MAG: hypothetical protein EHM55_18545 [Acidobacteriota bacterium]